MPTWKKTGRTATTYAVRWHQLEGPSEPDLVETTWTEERYDSMAGSRVAWTGNGGQIVDTLEGLATSPVEALRLAKADRLDLAAQLRERVALTEDELRRLERLERRRLVTRRRPGRPKAKARRKARAS